MSLRYINLRSNCFKIIFNHYYPQIRKKSVCLSKRGVIKLKYYNPAFNLEFYNILRFFSLSEFCCSPPIELLVPIFVNFPVKTASPQSQNFSRRNTLVTPSATHTAFWIVKTISSWLPIAASSSISYLTRNI